VTVAKPLLVLLVACWVGAVAHAEPAVNTIDMDSWESQVVGGVFGTYCGYYKDRRTLIGKALGIKDYADCEQRFSLYAPVCVQRLKQKGEWHITSRKEGSKLGEALGGCIGGAFERAAKGK
jgi:hypothetical protein